MDGVITEKNYPIERIWILKSVLGALLILLILTPSFIFGNVKSESYLYLIIYLVYIPFSIALTIFRRMNFYYSIEDKFLTIKQGVINKQQRTIPYGVIQNIFVRQSIFDRLFGLASLTLENASMGAGSQQGGEKKFFGMTINGNSRQKVESIGSSGNKVSIPGLKKSNAEILKGIVLQKMKDNPVNDSGSGL